MIQKPRTAWPFIGEILSHEPGRALLARRCVDAAEDLFLEDHALGGTVSISDPSLCALSLMPFTMTMEMAAEAAAALHKAAAGNGASPVFTATPADQGPMADRPSPLASDPRLPKESASSIDALPVEALEQSVFLKDGTSLLMVLKITIMWKDVKPDLTVLI